jgi:hypothetical protein
MPNTPTCAPSPPNRTRRAPRRPAENSLASPTVLAPASCRSPDRETKADTGPRGRVPLSRSLSHRRRAAASPPQKTEGEADHVAPDGIQAAAGLVGPAVQPA